MMKKMKNKLIKKIKDKKAKIGIIGLGYVGLPLAIRFREEEFNIVGFDTDKNKIAKLNKKKSYIDNISDEKLKELFTAGNALFTANYKKISDCDVLILCVPTPLNKFKEPDLSYVTTTIDTMLPYTKKGQVVSLESTTYPGTTEEELVAKLKEKKFNVGKDFFVIYSPEREDPGNLNFTTKTIPKVCGGYSPDCTDVGVILYSMVIDQVVKVSSLRAAEMTKLLENIHRAVNIGLVNELKVICDKMDIDIYEVIDAASSKPFGFTPYYPGPGLGGHCIPIDPFYLTWKAKEHGINTRFIELSGEINASMPNYVVNKISECLNERKKSIKSSSILIIGAAYKKNISDMRESPSVEIMDILINKGAKVSYHDPYVDHLPNMRKYNLDLKSTNLSSKILSMSDVVVISTDHDNVDYELVYKYSSVIVDCRGRYKNKRNKIIRA